ncbi:Gfo/Idh/MocA family oxidoreductase [bacterium]|nr:Gfo/Idh/MocA family oxidoreductase [bacterium]
MRKLGVAVIGCGAIGPAHAKAVTEIEEAKLVAVCDAREERARKLAEQLGVEWYTDYDKVLERDDVDVVSICTPSGMHAEMGIKAAKAKKHIICEKPLDVTLEKCDALIRAAKENGVKLGGIFQHRFAEESRMVKKLVEEGKLGKIALADMDMKWYRSQAYYDSDAWRGTWALDGGGCLMNQGVHFVDLLLWIMGPVEWVQARTDTLTHNIEVEDTAVAILKFRNGALGAIVATTSAYPGVCARISVAGYNGSVVWEDDKITFLKIEGEEEETKTEKPTVAWGASDPMAIPAGLHTRNIYDIIRAIIEDRDPLITGEEARKAVELNLAIYKSSQTGEKVYLPLTY